MKRTGGQEHVSKNVMFWRPDPNIDAARQLPGWMKFHHQCGLAGLYYDSIEKQGRGYSCVTFRLERRTDRYVFHQVATGEGRTVVDALLSAFDASVAAGWPISTEVRDILTAVTPAPRLTRPVISDDDLLGGSTADVTTDDLLGGPSVTQNVTIDDSELV